MTIQEAFLEFSSAKISEERACMVLSDLTGSTSAMWTDAKTGVGLQAAHEALCEDAASPIARSQLKALGDGVMIEIEDPLVACTVAMQIVAKAEEIRMLADGSLTSKSFENFRVKVTVVSGEFRRARGTQKWVGLLPTKVTRMGNFARSNEIWIDNQIAESIRPSLGNLGAEYDPDPRNGAAFYVLLKGLEGNRFAIHQLRKKGEPTSLTKDEQAKEYILSWTDVVAGLKSIVSKVRASDFKPTRVVGIGRSGAIIAGIVAGNLELDDNRSQVPVDVCNRYHREPTGPGRIISTITEPEEIYNADQFQEASEEPRSAWQPGPVLLVMAEAKTDVSFRSVRTWLQRRGVREIKTAALTKGWNANPDFYELRAESAWLPWQFKSGYDQDWPTYILS